MTTPTQQLSPMQQYIQQQNNSRLAQPDGTPLWKALERKRQQQQLETTPVVGQPQQIDPQNWQTRLQTNAQTGQIQTQAVAGGIATRAQMQAQADLKKWQKAQADSMARMQKNYNDQMSRLRQQYAQLHNQLTYTTIHGQQAQTVTSPGSTAGAPQSQQTVQKGQYIFNDPTDNQIAGWARQAGWSEADLPMVIAVAQAESSRNNNATHGNSNGSTDYGLMQINTVHAGQGYVPNGFFTNGGWKDPVQNLKVAKAIKDNRGSWDDWVTFQNGAYSGYHPAYHVATQNSVSVAPQQTGGGVSTSRTGALRNQIISTTMKYLGTPYVFGGDSLTQGVDCSGLVHEIYSMFGFKTPRTADEYAHPERWSSDGAYGGSKSVTGRRVAINQLEPGDLICYNGGWRGPGLFGHVVIYAGNGQIIESPDVGLTVRRRALRQSEYDKGNMVGIHLNLPGG